MPARDGRPGAALGFLTVVEMPEAGLLGGYLVTNAAGRPLEFHCTAPVRANRAQEILYGPTLRPYLYGEQIGRALAAKATTDVRLICTDCEPALALREFVTAPVVLIEGAAAPAPDPTVRRLRIDGAHSGLPRLHAFVVADKRLAVAPQHAADATRAAELADLVAPLDLAEPFERIREALAEAQRGGP